MIYQSKPLFMPTGAEVEIQPIDAELKFKKQNGITHGLLFQNGKPAVNKILKIYRETKSGRKVYVGQTVTDSFGQFFIPLANHHEYILKVYSLKEETENLEMVVE